MPRSLLSVWTTISLSLLTAIVIVTGLDGSPARAADASPNGDEPAAGAALHDLYDQLKSGRREDRPAANRAADRPTVYLTFDDGPSRLTPQVLDILKTEGVKATFFAIGQSAEDYPAHIKRILSEGHSLGNHSYDHVYQTLYEGFPKFWEEIRHAETVFTSIAGVRPDIVRAPGGTASNFDVFYYYLMSRAGYTVFDWNVDSGDSSRAGVPAKEIAAAVKNAPLRREMVVLMHDGSGHGETVKALPEIIRHFKDNGYSFAPLTSRVKPVQFAVGGFNRWKRKPVSYAEFEQMLQLIGKDAAKGPDRAEPSSDPEADENADIREPGKSMEPPIPLKIRLDGEEWRVGPEAYSFKYGRFALPLRLLVERIGGKVGWEASTRTATVEWGNRRLVYDTVRHTITEYLPNGEVQLHRLADFSVDNGVLYAPLRGTMEMLDNRVTGYKLSDGTREVDVAIDAGCQFSGADAVMGFLRRGGTATTPLSGVYPSGGVATLDDRVAISCPEGPDSCQIPQHPIFSTSPTFCLRESFTISQTSYWAKGTASSLS